VSDSDELDVYTTELLQRENGGERTTIRLGPHTAVVLAMVIRWTIDRDQFAEYGELMFGRLLDQLRLMFVEDLDHTRAVEVGQRPDHVDLQRREHDGEQATLSIGPFSAFLLVGAVIWAVRCRRLNELEADTSAALLRQLWPVVATDPRGRKYIDQALTSGTASRADPATSPSE